MAFVFVAIGALMSGAGLYAVISGYSIIQVEEGWASVISGSVLIAGGIITIALAVVLRALGQLKDALNPLLPLPADRPGPAIGAPSLGSQAFDLPLTAPAVETQHRPDEAPGAAVAALIEPATPAEDSSELSAPLHDDRPSLEPRTPAAPKPSEVRSPSRTKAPFGIKPLAGATKPLNEDTPIEAPAPVVEPKPAAEPSTPAPAPRPADDYKLETPSTPEHDIPRAVRPVASRPPKETPPPPASDDWLDRAFAELDRDGPPFASSLQKEIPKPVLEPVGVSQPSVREAAASPEPPATAEPDPVTPSAQEQTLPPPTSAVIGRYESDGTSYVMYADGSIEAHSAAGVYRFASMAELKAFIET